MTAATRISVDKEDMQKNTAVDLSRIMPAILLWPPLISCVMLVLSTQATTGDISRPSNRRDILWYQRQVHPTRPHRRRPQQQRQCRHQTHRMRGLLKQFQSTTWESSRLVWIARGIRGGQQPDKRGDTYETSDQTPPDEEARCIRDFPPPSSPIASKQHDGSNAAVEKIEKLAAELRAKRDDITAEVRARGEALAAELKAKQEMIADEVLRDRSPEAFGELNGHHSYDSATAGMDVANRRSFFLGIRRIVLLVQVVEFITACSWQIAFPYGGVAGFLASDHDKPEITSDWAHWMRDSRGRLGIAVAAALGQAALYTILLVFFGCDRVVLRAVRVTGWEHGAAAAWALFKTFVGVGKLHYLAATTWLAGVAVLCAYFGRQL